MPEPGPPPPRWLVPPGATPPVFFVDSGGTLVGGRASGSPLPPNDALLLGRTLGQGGMGWVREARQQALGRSVAVKTIRPDRAHPSLQAQLYREAWAMGNVEHPNIVPVYALTQAEDGEPAVVMRLVQGVSWSEALAAPEAYPHWLAGRDPLSAHLDVLEQITRAVAFAHHRGVLHRDLKPENVLLGAFGEVWLVDWGLAVSLRPGSGPLPFVGDIEEIEGTPGFLAPEMALPDPEKIGIRSDVFQLGAILHLLLSGRPRFTGENPYEVLVATWRGDPPQLPPEVDPGLAALCRQATATNPEERPPHAEAFRRALAEARAHRGSWELSRRGLLRLQEVVEGPVAATRRDTEARFALEEALRQWPENPEAQAGLREVERRFQEQEVRRQALERLEADRDLGAGARERQRAGLGLALWGVLDAVALGALDHGGWLRLDARWLAFHLVAGIALVAWTTPTIRRAGPSAASQAETEVSLAAGLSLVGLGMVCAWARVDLPTAIALAHVHSGLSTLGIAAVSTPKLAAFTPIGIAAGALALALPSLAWWTLPGVAFAFGLILRSGWGALGRGPSSAPHPRGPDVHPR